MVGLFNYRFVVASVSFIGVLPHNRKNRTAAQTFFTFIISPILFATTLCTKPMFRTAIIFLAPVLVVPCDGIGIFTPPDNHD